MRATVKKMATHFCLSSNTYKNRVFEGFSRLQQSDEFVDMTLAAEGYLVKVHQTLIALASPFLKELLRSVPCQHPVLFLSNVSHKVLCFILEYIYTGEVNIPSGDVRTFLNAAQAMHITGLENIIPPPTEKEMAEEEMAKHVFYKPRSASTVNNAHITITDIQNVQIPAVNESVRKHPTTFSSDKARPSDAAIAAAKGCIKITGVENIPLITKNETGNEQASHIFHPRPPAARAFITINSGVIKHHTTIQQNNGTNTEKQDDEVVSFPITTNVPESEEISEFLSFMNVNTETNTRLNANIGNINTNDNITHDPSNMEMVSNVTNEDINSMPMIVEGHRPLYPEQLLNNIGNEVTTTVDCHNNHDNVISIDNATGNSQNDFGSLLNISSNSLIQDHDMAVDISISDLIDCDHVATPSTTNEINESSAINNNQTIDLTNCDNMLSPTTANEMAEESVVNKVQTNDLVDGDNIETANTANEATEICFVNQDQINDMIQKEPASMLFTISNRGSLHWIMDRFIYYCHHTRDNERTRRWRCLDYRALRCKATFDTQNDVIITRKLNHCHPNHEEKIYYKVMRRKVYPCMKMALEDIKQKKSTYEALTEDEEVMSN